MIDRIDHADPDATLMLLWLLICAALVGVYLFATWRTRKRNRWLPKPRPDSRSSMEYSKPHMPERKR